MCTIGRTTVKAAGEAHHRPDAEECTVRREQGRTDCGSKRGRNSFLSTAFIPLAQNNLTVDCYDSGECNSINVITRDNYEFLRDSYFRYSLLLQKEGLRYEHTWQKSRYLKGEGSKFSLHYGDLVPSVSLTAKAKENSTFGVSYTMRIRRPRINELDPYVNKSDPTQLSYGNPNLKAQHLNNLAIVHTLRANTLAMRISLNHSWSNDGIVRYSSMKDGRINTTFGNIARNRKTSLNAYASWNATRSTRLMLNGEVGYSDMRSREIDARNYGWHGNLNLGWQQNLPWQLKWSSNLEWMSRRYSLQGYDSGMMMISATLARSFLNDKLDVAISGMSGLGHGGKMYWESVSRTKDFTNISRFIEPMQDITIGITYTFGGKSRKYTEKTVSDSFEMGDSRIVKQQTKRRGKL